MCFCRLTHIPFEFVEVRVGKREHLTPEFEKINQFKTVPFLVEVNNQTKEEWKLSESHAIMRYLAITRKVPDHWYP